MIQLICYTRVTDTAIMKQYISVIWCAFLEMEYKCYMLCITWNQFFQLFIILHKMQKHKASVILKQKSMTHHIKCVYWDVNMYMFAYTFSIFSTSSFWIFSVWANQWIRIKCCSLHMLYSAFALHLRFKKINTTQHFFCTVNIIMCININMMLQKILPSFCFKITILFRTYILMLQVYLRGGLHTLEFLCKYHLRSVNAFLS